MSASLANCELYDRRKKRGVAFSSAIIAALLALAIFNPWTFGFVNGLTGSIFGRANVISNSTGRPTTVGLIVHTVVLFLIGFLIYYNSMRPGARPMVCCDPAVLQVGMQ